MYGIHYCFCVDILVHISEISGFLGKSYNFVVNLQYFSRIYSIYCEILMIKSLLFVIFLVSSLWSVYKSIDFRSQREGSIFVLYLFSLKQVGIVCFIHITLYIYLTGNCLEFACNMYVLNFNHKLVLGDSHYQYIINPQYFCANLQISVNIVRISSLNIVKY